jgi:hypothetical protein
MLSELQRLETTGTVRRTSATSRSRAA